MKIYEEIDKATLKILGGAPEGLHFTDLVHRVQAALPHLNKNNIYTMVSTLGVRRKTDVTKPARGLYVLASFREALPKAVPDKPEPVAEKIKEEHFYKPFANYLVNELEECTKAIPLGGNRFKDKWGTPDVIGLREPRRGDIIKFGIEIVSAEVKLDAASLITAFGQACAYRLFSHKSYIVVPLASAQEDLARLDTLCLIFGIGLILFDADDSQSPAFEIRARAAKHEPDMFYVNQCMRLIEDVLFG